MTLVDVLVLIVLAILLALDWLQTRQIAKHPDRWYESWNLVLPAHPSLRQVDGYFALVGAATVLLAYLLPADARLVLAGAFAVLEATCVVHNYRNDIRP